MQKLYTFLGCCLLVAALHAQTTQRSVRFGDQCMPTQKKAPNPYAEINVPLAPGPLGHHIAPRGMEIAVGNTYWDAQAYGSMSSRIFANDKNEPVAYWLYSGETSGFTDRGTRRSFRYNGTWVQESSGRVEANRTGFPAAVRTANGDEFVISHNTGVTPFSLWVAKKPNNGSTWTEKAIPGPAGIRMLWPKVATGGPDGNSIHVIGITAPTGGSTGGVVYEGMNGHLLYYRSTDGGNSWDKTNIIIPGLDKSEYNAISADEYNIDASGSTVAISVFQSWDNILLFKSSDNGNAWSKKTVYDFPDILENYQPVKGQAWSVNDLKRPSPFTNDPLALISSDGFGSVLVDKSGEAHVFFGFNYVSRGSLDTTLTVYYPTASAIAHWKESFGDDNFVEIAGALDYDGNGTFDIGSLNEFEPYGSGGIATMPTAGIGKNNEIFMVYSACNEQFKVTLGTQDKVIRHLYAIKSTDNGNTWGNILELTDAPYVDPGVAGILECAWPVVARQNGDNLWVLYQQDYVPGCAIWYSRTPEDNLLQFIEVDPDDIPTSGVFSPDQSAYFDLNLYPMPAQHWLTVEANFAGGQSASIQVFDVLGKNVMSQQLDFPQGEQRLPLNISHLPSGTYLLRVQEGQAFATKTFVKG